MRQAASAVNGAKERPFGRYPKKLTLFSPSIDVTGERMHTCAQMTSEDSRVARTRRTGRRVGIAIFGVIVVSCIATWTTQILKAVFAPVNITAVTECKSGAKGLLDAVRRARLAAASETGDERAALARFRSALEPEWDGRASLQTVCGSDPKTRTALAEIDALRYAEEHAVRYEAVGLAPQRRRAQALYETLFAGDGSRAPSLP